MEDCNNPQHCPGCHGHIFDPNRGCGNHSSYDECDQQIQVVGNCEGLNTELIDTARAALKCLEAANIAGEALYGSNVTVALRAALDAAKKARG